MWFLEEYIKHEFEFNSVKDSDMEDFNIFEYDKFLKFIEPFGDNYAYRIERFKCPSSIFLNIFNYVYTVYVYKLRG